MKDAASVPSNTKDQLQARQQERRRRNARGRQKKEKRKEQLADVHLPSEEQAKAFKEAGLRSKGLWSLSHRNKARRISRLEPEPDKSKLIMFDLRKGYI